MRSPSVPGPRLLVGTAIVLLALNLRAAVGSVGVVLVALREDLGMDATLAGVLTTLPVLCFAVFGLTCAPAVRRLGLNRAAAAVLAVTAVGLALRAVVDDGVPFLLLSALALGACAVGNVILPALARAHFPDRVPLVSALYGAALMGGAALGSVVTVPAAELLGSWRAGVGMWSLLALVALMPWLFLLGRDVHLSPTPVTPVGLRALTRSRLAWACALCFGVQSAQAYAQFGWFPAILVDAGLSAGEAGAMQGLLSAVGLPLTLTLPMLISWAGTRPVLPWAFAVLTCSGWAGVLLAPTAAPWLWAILLGTAGCAFPWTLAMIGRRARTTDGTAALSGFTQGIGYLLAGLGPFGTGLLHDLTGSWDVPVMVLLVAGLLIGVFGTAVNRERFVEDELRA